MCVYVGMYVCAFGCVSTESKKLNMSTWILTQVDMLKMLKIYPPKIQNTKLQLLVGDHF